MSVTKDVAYIIFYDRLISLGYYCRKKLIITIYLDFLWKDLKNLFLIDDFII